MATDDLTVDFKAFHDQVTTSLVKATKSAGHIANQDLGFHRSSSEKLSRALDAPNQRLLQLTHRLLKAATKDTPIPVPKLQNVDSVEDDWRKVVDVVDDLLEKADASLDEFTGVLKRLSPAAPDSPGISPVAKDKAKRFPGNFSHVSMRKPQLDFHTKVDNHDRSPFRPLLTTKPHAIVSLEESLGEAGPHGYGHPYAHEIESYTYPSSTYEVAPPQMYSPPDQSRAVFVDTEDGVMHMLEELKQAKEMAVDLEHHDAHSFIGLVSLMQISTREKDWIVDTLKPWRDKLQVLNEVFADPHILKVFHGSNMDIKWLQRDLGLYVVGLFDTFYAASALHFPQKSLRYLLERFANFHAQKQYQLADWRVRPLPTELLDYARSDTHFLLYIYDHLRNMLVEASTPTDNLVDFVLEGSKKEALQVYERPVYDKDYGQGSGGWFKHVTQRALKFDNVQLGVYRAVHEWRDGKARQWDEGEQSILTLGAMWILAETMPTTVSALHSVLRPMPRVVSEHAKELVEVIRHGKDAGRTGLPLRDVVQQIEEKFGPSTIWNRKPKKPAPAEFEGLGATLQSLKQNGQMEGTPSAVVDPSISDEPVALRGNSSQLWGSILPRIMTPVVSSVAVATQALRSILPLPASSEMRFSHVTYQTPRRPVQTPDEPSTPQSIPHGTSRPVAEPNSDSIFTIRDRGTKRKSTVFDQPDDLDASLLPDDAGPDPATPATRTGKQRRKAEKRAKKDAQAWAAAQAEHETVPFDYANAQSVLHAKHGDGVNGTPRTVPQKGINPYAKALDTSTGVKKQKMEKAGKSLTFKK